MRRTRLEPREIEFAQPFADGPLGHLYCEAPDNLGAQIRAAPAHHAIFLRIGTPYDQGFQLGHLSGGQRRWLAGTVAGL